MNQKTLVNAFYKYLKGKQYSKSNITTYTNYVAGFMAFHNKKEVHELSNRAIELFIENVFLKRKYRIS
ncbi:phage integrase N-terminal SAM-like domain-containing protein [Psychroserpens sp.]|uniref:phage integrase N-terminal SAM-like domain-containing protein n=1 Tax=Psychroserpens sp. TaxID=2020870 RepID=UPI0039E63375